MRTLVRVCPIAVPLLLFAGRSAFGLDIELEVTGVGSPVSITDNLAGDNNPATGIIDFAETFGGQFQAEGRVRDAEGVFGKSIFISATPPSPNAIFRNIDSVDRDFTLTVNRTPFTGVGPVLGWSIAYSGSADDPTPGVVDIPAHSLALSVNSPPAALGAVVGTAITEADEIEEGNGGVDPMLVATSLQAVFTFTAGPGDEILLPEDELLEGRAIFVRVFDQQDRCIDKMNNRARQLVKKAAKTAEKCVKNVVNAGGGPSALCTTGLTSPKIDAAEEKLTNSFADDCAPFPLPAWGVNGGRCCEAGDNDRASCTMDSPDCDVGGTCTAAPACINGAATGVEKDLALDIFGGTALIGVDVVVGTAVIAANDVGRCQAEVIKRSGATLAERWKTFRKCKRTNLDTITDDPSLISTCLGPPQVDTNGKILKNELKLAAKVDSKCVNRGVVPIGLAFPGGKCSAEPDVNFAACVNARTACRFCLSANVADDIDPALDCDLFDDGTANSSCP